MQKLSAPSVGCMVRGGEAHVEPLSLSLGRIVNCLKNGRGGKMQVCDSIALSLSNMSHFEMNHSKHTRDKYSVRNASSKFIVFFFNLKST
jgi:hypothetical protein